MSTPPVIVVLAAGLGRRFGGVHHKLAQPLGASTVLGETVTHAIESGLPVVVVTTDQLRSDAASMAAGRDVVILPSSAQSGRDFGMGTSIAAGVAARPDAEGWLVLPGDMPMVQPATLRAVAAALASHPVVFAQFQGRRGHPVGFSSELFSDLLRLTGDEGARRIVARYPSHGMEVPDPGVLIDIDTQSDLAEVRSTVGAQSADRSAS
jgi:molybdenum cofactor cytidylyltransferase